MPPSYAEYGLLYTPASLKNLQVAVAKAQASGEPYALELEYVHAAGHTGWIDARGAAERDESGRIVALHGTVREITARRQSAQLLAASQQLDAEMAQTARLESALAQAKKLEILGLLASGMAHDFNHVLASVLGSFHSLKRTVKDERSQALVDRGLRGVDRATRLVRQWMGLARNRAQTDEANAVDLSGQLQSCVDLLQLSAGPEVRLAVMQAPACLVMVDAKQLAIALINLIINARDAMPDGGEIVVSLDTSADGRVAIRVRTSGTGMAPEVLERAREPFFTTKPVGQGTGLGLAMVHTFARQSGGALQLESRLGEGTCVSLVLPRASSQVAQAVERDDAAIAWNLHGNATILVVDDDALVRSTVVQYLRELHYTVLKPKTASRRWRKRVGRGPVCS